VAAGLNSKIMSIKRKAGGFRNAANFTTAIHVHCGGLTSPHTTAGRFQDFEFSIQNPKNGRADHNVLDSR
jgi:hypothetical protein